MEKVIEKMSGNVIIILFVVVILSSAFYMGVSERKLTNLNIQQSI